jgi:Fe-S cluster assembly protein SufD
LLSDDAQINTKPQLEIFADDVKCTHGATVGQLDAEMLFYLRARGLGSTRRATC